MNDTLVEKLRYYALATEEYLEMYFSKLEGIPETLLQSMRYSIYAGGKRLRPALCLGTFEIFSKEKIDTAVMFAASIEMIHTYSLIHDDLPAMDDDDVRRGKPSNHMVFGEAGAILAGDALLNSAMENLMMSIEGEKINAKVKAARIIMEAAGPTGMIGGQSLDITGTDDSDSLNIIHEMKTGALIKGAVLAGGILAGCSKKDEVALAGYADNLGCAFQIKDDILDVVGKMESIGKPTGSDTRNKKSTYTSVYGVDEAEAMLLKRVDDAISSLMEIEGNTEFLKALAVYIGNREE